MLRKIVAISTGDTDGIGLEVTRKALQGLKIPSRLQIHVYSQSRLNSKVPAFHRFHEAIHSRAQCVNILSSKPPPLWVEEIARLCLSGEVSAMVTGPLSKGLIHQVGLQDMGHTEILKRICQQNSAYMGFVGKSFNVISATGHHPIEEVPKKLSPQLLKDVIQTALDSRYMLKKSLRDKPIGVLGLNPHAGDQGIIGTFEQEVLIPVLKNFSSDQVKGPLVPDVAFQKQRWSSFSFYIALYHDQGLIPFKMAHGYGGVHTTLGIKIKRCSVDHGTAKDIFGKGIANPQSMIDAIKFGMKLAEMPSLR